MGVRERGCAAEREGECLGGTERGSVCGERESVR